MSEINRFYCSGRVLASRGALVLSAALVALMARTSEAETYYFKPNSGTAQDSQDVSGFTAAEWYTSTEYAGDPVVATEDHDYVVGRYVMRTPPSGDVTFVGKSLRIDKTNGSAGTVVYSGSSNVDGDFTTSITRYNKLIFANGGYTSWRSGISRVYGPVEVTATAKSPFLISNGGVNMYAGHCFYGAFTGAEGTGLRVQSGRGFGYRLIFAGDMSGYEGVITAYNTTSTDDGTNVTLCATSDAKTLHSVTMQKGTSLRAWTATDAFSISTLAVSGSCCRLVVPVDLANGTAGKITVASLSGVSEAQPLTVAVETSGTPTGAALSLPVFEFTDASSSITTNCFVLPVVHASLFDSVDLPAFAWKIQDKEGASGVRQLVLTSKPVAFQKAADEVVYAGGAEPPNSSLTNETAWTVDGAPHEGVDYVSQKASIVSSFSGKKSETLTFAGDSLVLGTGCMFYIYCYNFASAGPIVFMPKSSFIFHVSSGGLRTLTAPEVRFPGSLTGDAAMLQCYQNSVGVLNAPITGTGVINVQGRNSSGSPMGGLALAGDNSAFAGRFYVYVTDCWKNGNFLGPDETRYVWLQINAANQLGGAIPNKTADSPCYNALELRHYAGLTVTNDVTLAEPTRGVYINEYGRFVVQNNAKLTLNEQLTLNGTCRKQGNGTLALGGTLKFTKKVSETPVADSNIVTVVEGSLEIAGANAVNGAALAFAEGTKLIVKANLPETGALLTKEGSALTLPDGVETFPCAIDASGVEPSEASEYVIPLFTVRDALAPTVRKLAVENPFGGRWKLFVRETTNQDGTITFSAVCQYPGLVLLLK